MRSSGSSVDWIQDQKGFLGYAQGWLCRGPAGGLGRIGTGAKRAPREVHVDLSQELISDWSYEKFQQITQWVLAKQGHFGRIDVALDDRSGIIDVDRLYEAVVKGQCVSHFRQSRLIAGWIWSGSIWAKRSVSAHANPTAISASTRQLQRAKSVGRRTVGAVGNGMERNGPTLDWRSRH